MPRFDGQPVEATSSPAPRFQGEPVASMPRFAGDPVGDAVEMAQTRPRFAGEPVTARFEGEPVAPRFVGQEAVNDAPVVPAFNMARGAVERGGDLLSGLFTTAGKAADFLEQKLPLGGFVFDGGLPKYRGPEAFAKAKEEGNFEEPLSIAADRWRDLDAGYVPNHTWESVKEAFTDGDLRASDAGEVIAYGFEQGIKSIPDMVAVLFNLPAYVVARSGEMGEERARNKNKGQADITDVVEAVPFALGSAILERVGAGRILDPATIGREALEQGINNAVKKVGKDSLESAGTEALTEFVQEGIIEYTGERFGTGAEMSLAEGLERGVAGAVAGGVFGGAVGATSSTYGQINRQSTPIEQETGQPVGEDVSFANDIERAEYQEAVSRGLDMSQEARMQRAQEMGFNTDTPLYHGTNMDFQAFDMDQVKSRFPYSFGIHFTTDPKEASVYADGINNAATGFNPESQNAQESATGGNVLPTFARYQYPLVIETTEAGASMEADLNRGPIIEELVRAKREGKPYDAVVINRRRGDEYDHSNVIVFDPAQVRSINAAFDPGFSDSGDLMASKDTEASGFDIPMPGWVPMYRGIAAPMRPQDNTFMIGSREVKLNPESNPTRREGIRTQLQSIIGPRLYQGKIKGKATLGFYRRSNSEVRIRNYDDVEVMAHEMAHYLDFHHAFNKDFTKLRTDPKYRDQVKQFSYTSQPNKVSSEGFAEFVRLWLTQYNQARSRAPDFTKAFEAQLAKDKPLFNKMRRLQEDAHRWFLQGPRATFKAKSGKHLTPAQQIQEFIQREPMERFRQNVIDKIHGFKVVERTTKGSIRDATKSAYKQFQMVNGAESVHEAVIKYGTPSVTSEGDFKFSGKGLQEIFTPATKHGWERFEALMEYFKARRANELMQQGRENLFTKEEIASGLAYGREFKEFPGVFEEFQQFNQRMLDFYVQMGLITDGQRIAFAKANREYVPFHRVVEKIEEGQGEGVSIERRLFGRTLNTRDIAENIVEGLAANIRAAMISRAKQTLYKDIITSQEGSLFAARIPMDSKQVQVKLQQQAQRMANALAELGLGISSDGMILAEGNRGAIIDTNEITRVLMKNPDLMTFWQDTPPQTLETYVDSAVIEGQRIYFEVRSPLLVEALTGLRGLKSGTLLNALFRVKNIQTRTVTAMLQFLGPNAIRDTVSSFVISKNGFRPVWDTLRGMGEMIFETPLYQEFMLNGGGYGTRIEARTEEMRSRGRLDVPSQTGWDMAAKAIAGWDRFASVFEYGSRLGDYRLGRKKGHKNALEAAWEAREIATDFSKHPRSELWSKYLRTVPFMNAGIQGLDKTAREIFEIKGEMKGANLVRLNDAKVKFLMGGSLLTGMTTLLWLLNNDDERYRQLTPDQKARFWWIFPPEGGNPIKIPRPYDVGHVFATIPEISLDYMKERNGKDFADNLAWTLINTLAIGDYPGIFQPIIEAGLNETFTGAPVIPQRLMSVPSEYQYTDRTPILYRNLGKSLGVSPLLAEHYAKGYLRYLEAYIADASENLLWNREQWGQRPFSDSTPIDYLSYQFVGESVPYRTKWTDGYYRLKERAAGIRSAFNSLQAEAIRDGRPIRQFSENRVNQAIIALDSTFRQIDRQFADQDQVLAAIKYSPNMPKAEKEKRIESWYQAKNQVLGQFYQQAEKTIRDIEREMGKSDN